MYFKQSQYKIAHILPYEDVSGTEQATLRIMQAVEGDQFTNVPFCLSTAAPVAKLFTAAGYETVSWDPEIPDRDHLKGFLYRTNQLRREFRSRKIDLVHCADLYGGIYATIAAKLAGLPVICHVRNRYADAIYGKKAIRPVDKFVFVSHHTWSCFNYRIAKHRGLVIYDGIDVDGKSVEGEAERRSRESVRREFSIPDGAKIVGMVGRVAPQKDYATLAKAAARVVAADPNTRFLIVGGYSEPKKNREHYEKVQRMLAASDVAPNFIFTGFRHDVPRLLSAMDVFVLSTNFEGLPLVILEAMAHSKPVVATSVDGVPEVVIDGKNGLLYPHQDDEKLAAQLLTLLKDKAYAAGLGEAGRQFVKINFSRDQFAANIIDLYGEMLHITKARSAAA